MAEGGVGRDADLAGGAFGGVAGKGDDVGGRRITEEVGMQLREGGVGQEDEGELAGRRARFRFSNFDFRLAGGRGVEVRVEGVDDAG